MLKYKSRDERQQIIKDMMPDIKPEQIAPLLSLKASEYLCYLVTKLDLPDETKQHLRNLFHVVIGARASFFSVEPICKAHERRLTLVRMMMKQAAQKDNGVGLNREEALSARHREMYLAEGNKSTALGIRALTEFNTPQGRVEALDLWGELWDDRLNVLQRDHFS